VPVGDIEEAGGRRRMSMPEPDRRMGGWTGVGYDDIEMGLTYPSQPLPVSAEDIARFYRSIGEARPAPEVGTRIPAFLLNEIRALKKQMKFPPGRAARAGGNRDAQRRPPRRAAGGVDHDRQQVHP
jgi:hypothetical protein